jgi:peptide/nickel transport system substrate-binding protein
MTIGKPTRRQILGAAAALAVVPRGGYAAPLPLRVGMSLVDIPHLWGAPEGGFEGLRFAGYPLYDALVGWDLSQADKPSRLIPGLATSWRRDPADPKRWIVTLRRGVKFHDGSVFDADAAVWNFGSQLDPAAPHYYPPRASLNRSRLPSLAGATKIDDYTIAVLTNVPDALTPYQLSFLLMASPAHYAKTGGWDQFARDPSGTGPFRFGSLTPRASLDLLRNDAYWDKPRIAKAEALQFRVAPDANTKVAALRSGQLDLIESVVPDALDSLVAAGFTVQKNVYPHIWNWSFSLLPDSPFRDVRVRKAANLAIDRDGLVQLLNGTALAAKSYMIPSSAWAGHPAFKLTYDPAAAKALLAEAGFAGQTLKAKILISNSGGGQMQPLPMNEFIKSNLEAVGIDVEFQVVDFITLFTDYRMGAASPAMAGVQGLNLAFPMQDPTSVVRGFDSALVPPKGANWGAYSNPAVDAALHAAQAAVDDAALDRAMTAANEAMTNDAAGLIVVHDMNVRAASKRVRGLVSPQNWFLDFTPISVAD